MKPDTFTLERSMSRTVAHADWGNWRVCSSSGSHVHASLASFDEAHALKVKLNAIAALVEHSPALVFAFVTGQAAEIIEALRDDEIEAGYALDPHEGLVGPNSPSDATSDDEVRA